MSSQQPKKVEITPFRLFDDNARTAYKRKLAQDILASLQLFDLDLQRTDDESAGGLAREEPRSGKGGREEGGGRGM